MTTQWQGKPPDVELRSLYSCTETSPVQQIPLVVRGLDYRDTIVYRKRGESEAFLTEVV